VLHWALVAAFRWTPPSSGQFDLDNDHLSGDRWHLEIRKTGPTLDADLHHAVSTTKLKKIGDGGVASEPNCNPICNRARSTICNPHRIDINPYIN
jgi:hypothetical protein